MALKQSIENISKKTLPWAPTSEDLTLNAAKKLIPSVLFNFIAWVVRASTDPQDDKLVEVSDTENRRILTIAQDIVYLASKGKKVMPKHSNLSMAVRHFSRSAQLIGILNGFGYCVSHTSVLEHDTALVQLEVQKGGVTMPSSLQKSTFTTLVWDNNDFGEQTLSRKGTTHNTNGIAIQHKVAPLQVTSAAPLTHFKKTTGRSMPEPESTIVKFKGAKKSSPENFPDDINIDLQHYMVSLTAPKRRTKFFT